MKNKLTFPVPTKRRDIEVPIVERTWFVTDEGLMIRKLHRSDYEPCVFGRAPREFDLRLRPDDPRPLGRRVFFGKYWTDAAYVRSLAAHYAKMEFGVWYGDWDCPTPAPAPRTPLLLTWPVAEGRVA